MIVAQTKPAQAPLPQVESELARTGRVVHIDDATLGRVSTLGEIDSFLSARSADA